MIVASTPAVPGICSQSTADNNVVPQLSQEEAGCLLLLVEHAGLGSRGTPARVPRLFVSLQFMYDQVSSALNDMLRRLLAEEPTLKHLKNILAFNLEICGQ